jgi:hypothetical protein
MVKNKRGQFFLIAAILIIATSVGFITISNHAIKINDQNFENLEQEIKIESEKIIDYGIFNGKNVGEINDLFEDDFFPAYYEKIGDYDFVFIAGEEGNWRAIGNKKTDGEFSIDFGSGFQSFSATSGNFVEDYVFVSSQFSIKLEENTYGPYLVEEGQNFYYLVSKKYKEEKEVITG